MFNLFNKSVKKIDKAEVEIAQVAAKDIRLLKEQFLYFENAKYDKQLNQSFDYYTNDVKILNKILEILTDKKFSKKEDDEYSFLECINILIKEKYLFDYNDYNNKRLFNVLNNFFNLKICENEFYERLIKKYDKYDSLNDVIKDELQIIELCTLLKESNLEIIHFYSIGEFYSYGVFSIDKIKQINALFETL